MIRKVSATHIFTEDGQLSENKVVILDPDGKILAVEQRADHDPTSILFFEGTILPGFINTHCHLELSHMKNKVASGTGLIPFINNVVRFRDIDQGIINLAIQKADQEMFDNGIVAVGDISNKADTSLIKSNSQIDYYTFVEMFDFMQPTKTRFTIDQYEVVMKAQSNQGRNKKSLAPHAPYTVTPGLFDYINDHNKHNATISIHNQETLPENELFLTGTGPFVDFYQAFGLTMDHFKHIGQSSIYYILKNLKPNFKTIFVHNTLTEKEEILAAHEWNSQVYWATCPNANLYIENKLPNYQNFIDTRAKMTIGTDSLTSNWQLSIWEEVKTIKKYASYLPIETIITWSTINGAMALGYEDRLGSISIGKYPGLVLISGDINSLETTSVHRI